jgi:hypothetical protein
MVFLLFFEFCLKTYKKSLIALKKGGYDWEKQIKK